MARRVVENSGHLATQGRKGPGAEPEYELVSREPPAGKNGSL